MSKITTTVSCKARLLQPAVTGKPVTWTFLVLPETASARLPSRGMLTVEGTLNGCPFSASLNPDGQSSHWLKVDQALRKKSAIAPGDLVNLEFAPVAKEPEPKVPVDLCKALSVVPAAQTLWNAITPVARRDWIHWIESARQDQTRTRRISNACDMLAKGKRRVCCFDRSGIYSKSLNAPRALGFDTETIKGSK